MQIQDGIKNHARLYWYGDFRKNVFAKVTLVTIVFFFRDLAVELPFTLTHPKPPESPPPSRAMSMSKPADGSDQPVDTNLIQLDTK